MPQSSVASRRHALIRSAESAVRGVLGGRRVVTALAIGAAGLGAAASAAPAVASGHHAAHAHAHAALMATPTFETIDNPGDPTFNQLLGINNAGEIAGYFGSGAQGHPNQGYTIDAPYTSFSSENFPGSTQTQVTGLNDRGVTVGFWSDTNTGQPGGANFGFYARNGIYYSVDYPTASNSNPPVNQLLGVNDSNAAVGFYNDAQGNAHGYTYSIATNRYAPVNIAGATSTTAAAINNRGDIAGFETDSTGITHGFVRHWYGGTTLLTYPGAAVTQALGINGADEVVGFYNDAQGIPHGFVWTWWNGFKAINDPAGVNGTTLNGIDNAGEAVGFYTDGATNTHGVLVTP